MEPKNKLKKLHTGHNCPKAFFKLIIKPQAPVPLNKLNSECWGERLKVKLVILRRLAGLSVRKKPYQLPQLKQIDPKIIMASFNDIVIINQAKILVFPKNWLMSIINCYADFGSDLQKANATTINTLVTMERIRRTYNFKMPLSFNKGAVGELKTLTEEGIDTHVHMLLRIIRVLKRTPILLSLFIPIMKYWISDPNSVFGLLDRTYPEQLVLNEIRAIFSSGHYNNP